MSKSLGNGIDPMEVIDEYGADALRFFLTTNTAAGMDLRYDEDKVKATWNFINKIWNASRFVLMKIDGFNEKDYSLENLKECDKWIITKLNQTIKDVKKSMDKYDFNIAGSALYNFIWSDFCDKYIELSKFYNDNTTKSVLNRVLTDILKMLHPFMPYVTEEIYQKLPICETDSIMISSYPKYNKKEIFENDIDDVWEFITMFRNKKSELGIGKDYSVILKIGDKVINTSNEKSECIKYKDLEIDIIYNNTENVAFEKERLEKEKENLEKSIARREKLLGNDNYVNKAPKEIVEKERDSLKKEKELLRNILDKFTNL